MMLQVLPGALRHLEPENSLTMRISFVSFDGARALEASRVCGENKPLEEKFAREYCGPTVEGIEVRIT